MEMDEFTEVDLHHIKAEIVRVGDRGPLFLRDSVGSGTMGEIPFKICRTIPDLSLTVEIDHPDGFCEAIYKGSSLFQVLVEKAFELLNIPTGEEGDAPQEAAASDEA
jgi:hypothetical protein